MLTNSDTESVLVVGGGIGGLTAALALARTGRGVRVLERAPQLAEIGAGLQVGPNASRALDRLGVLDAVASDAFFPNRLVLRDALSGKRLTHLDTGDAFRQRFGYRYFVAHRADVHSAILEACEETGLVELLPDKDVIEVEERPEGAAVGCSDGTTYSSRALIAADGLHSITRRMLLEDGEPVDSGYVAYRGTVPIEVTDGVGGLREPDAMVIWVGPGLHLVQYPVRSGKLCNQVATIDTRRYSEYGGDLTAQLQAAFAQTCPDVRAGLSLMDTSRRWPMLDREPASGWARGAITLLGDAAHPMLQYLAQGACQAIEDSVVLADCVGQHDDAADAFRAYEGRRSARAARVQTTARKWGEILHVDGVAAELRAALLTPRAADDYEAVDWLYDFDAMAPVQKTAAA